MTEIRLDPRFFYLATIASFAAALAVLLVQVWTSVPTPAGGFQGVAEVYVDPGFQVRSWMILVQ